MKIKQQKESNYSLIKPIGELDASSAIEMDDVIKSNVDKGQYKFLINCSGLSYISSAGVGVFVSYLKDLEDNKGKFVFYNMKEGVYNVFETLGLHQILQIKSSERAAKKAINES